MSVENKPPKKTYKDLKELLPTHKPSYKDAATGVGPTRKGMETRMSTREGTPAIAPTPALATKGAGPKTRESAKIQSTTPINQKLPNLATSNTTARTSTTPTTKNPVQLRPTLQSKTIHKPHQDHNYQLTSERPNQSSYTPPNQTQIPQATRAFNLIEEIESMETDNILLEPAQPNGEQKTLLSLRQGYKRARCNLARVNSHLEFIQQCVHEEKTPRGLSVNVHCNAFLADLTTIKAKFKDVKLEAENEFTQSLIYHYRTVRDKLQKQITELESNMAIEKCRATSDEVKVHMEMMTKTKENVEKQEHRLEERKKRKMEGLNQPKEKRPKESRKNNREFRQNKTNERPRPPRPNYKPSVNPRQPRITRVNNEPQPLSTALEAPNYPAQPPMPNNAYQQPPPNGQVPQMTDLMNMIGQLLQQQQQAPRVQQPPTLLPQPPCAVGHQPPVLRAPQMSTIVGQPPPLSGYGHQGFR